MQRAGMRPIDIGELVEVGEPRVAPDGTRIAFTVAAVDLEANDYRSRVWLAESGGWQRPRPVTAGDARDGRPRWAPHGRSLAFVTSRRGEGSELKVLPLDGGEVRQLVAWPEEIEDLAWSPDGTRIAFLARQPDESRSGTDRRDHPARRIDRFFFRLDNVGWIVGRERHLYVVSAERDERPRQLTTGPFDDGGLTWSPDGEWLAFAAGRHDSWDIDWAVDLFRVRSYGSAEPERLTETGPSYRRPSWSPDGERIAFQVSDPRTHPRHTQVGALELASGAIKLLTTSLDRQCGPYLPGGREPVWLADDTLLIGVEDAGNVHLYKICSQEGSPTLLVGGRRQVSSWDAAAGTVAFTAGSATSLPELFVGEEPTTPLTALGHAFARARAIVEPERFTALSADGAEVEAWIIRPVGFEEGRRYPPLLNIHGGPFTQYGNRLFDEFQCQAGAGYVVLYANPRGSSGYSEAWGRAIRGPTADEDPGSGWGGVDFDDLMAVVDTAVARFPFVDPERLGVLGGSYGGYMTSWIIGHTDRFKAACSERAANNLLTMEWNSDIATVFRAEIGPSHLDDPEVYLRLSPISYVRDMHTPLLIIHSEDDLRCPIEQSEQLFVALRLLGRDVEYVRFPGEGHELSRSGAPRHRVERMELILDFFGRHLGPEG